MLEVSSLHMMSSIASSIKEAKSALMANQVSVCQINSNFLYICFCWVDNFQPRDFVFHHVELI